MVATDRPVRFVHASWPTSRCWPELGTRTGRAVRPRRGGDDGTGRSGRRPSGCSQSRPHCHRVGARLVGGQGPCRPRHARHSAVLAHGWCKLATPVLAGQPGTAAAAEVVSTSTCPKLWARNVIVAGGRLLRQPLGSSWDATRVIVSLLYRATRALRSVPAVLLHRDTARAPHCSCCDTRTQCCDDSSTV